MTKKFFLLCLTTVLSIAASHAAAVAITGQGGWFESAYVAWTPVAGTDYRVYVSPAGSDSWTQLDSELLRAYPGYHRADALGLKAGSYRFRVVPVSDGREVAADAATSAAVEVRAYDRSGFAHVGMADGIGAYRNDGTLKDGAKVLYVWAGNAKTITHKVVTNSKGATTVGTGLQSIIDLYQKGYDTTPLAIRIIGTVRAADMDKFSSSAEGLQLKGNKAHSLMPITVEGVGSDAAIWGFGILARNCHSTEFRNFAIMLFMDDALSVDTDNSNIWIHNMDFFYGQTGSDADQAKGDGTVDVKGQSKNVTVAYNHFYDSGKASLGGMKSETTDCWMTYHHNWFDHSDSRHPRVRTAFYHVYNNYFDGVSKYGVGVTYGGSAFVESNDFRNTKYPMLISMQGTDAEGDGTFSGENGGVIKAFNNNISGARKVQYWSTAVQTTGQWDAVLVTGRDEAVSATAKAGGSAYNAAADQAARTTYMENNIEDPSTVRATVTGQWGAGRMQHGDFQWTFDNATADSNSGVDADLKKALEQYKPTVTGFADGTPITDGGSGQGGTTPDNPDNPDNPGGDNPDPGTQTSTTGEFLYFPGGSKTANPFFSVTGNTTKDYGTTTYVRGGVTYDCNYTLKLESSTVITFTPAKAGTLRVALSPSGGNNLYLNDQKLTGNASRVVEAAVSAGKVCTIKKADKAYIFYIELDYDGDEVPTGIMTPAGRVEPAAPAAKAYSLSGRSVSSARKGVYIVSGRKVAVR